MFHNQTVKYYAFKEHPFICRLTRIETDLFTFGNVVYTMRYGITVTTNGDIEDSIIRKAMARKHTPTFPQHRSTNKII